MADERNAEAGFSLVEVLVCVALTVAACVSALGVLPTLAHASQGDVLRDAATNAGEVAIERARAAAAYYPATGYRPNHSYALNASSTYVAAAHVHHAYCGAPVTTTDVSLAVTSVYDVQSDTIAVTVRYPRNPCDPTVQNSVVLDAQLAPSALMPGTTIATPIDDLSRQ